MPILQYLMIFIFASVMLFGCSKSEASQQPNTIDDDNSPTAVESHTWTYVGNTGPVHWGELSKDYLVCAKGRQQSPINITSSTPKKGVSMNFSYKPSPLDSVNNGHTLEQYFPEGQQSFEVDGHKYKLVRLHFHVPSEHAINGKHSPMEMHIVHQDDKGNAAVVALMIEKGKSSSSMTNIFANLPESPGVHEQKAAVKIDANDFIPSNHTAWHYDGSLTTPPCGENVQWYVMKNPITIAPDELEEFTKDIIHFDARPVQPLNGRTVELLQE